MKVTIEAILTSTCPVARPSLTFIVGECINLALKVTTEFVSDG